MSISILLLSIVFALIQAGLAWMLLALEPVAALLENIPGWLLTGGIFGLGMLLTFVVIIIIGLLDVNPKAAGFVRGHLGRTMLLGLLCTLLASCLGMGGELIYQAGPMRPGQGRAGGKSDVCFVLDYSASMAGAPERNLENAFAQALASLPDGLRVSVVRYDSNARTLLDWTALSAESRPAAILAVQGETTGGGTSFEAALSEANRLALLAQGRRCAVVMLSDGDANISGVQAVAPALIENSIPVYALYMGDQANPNLASLQRIADETGGELRTSAGDLVNLSAGMISVSQQAAGGQRSFIPDTLLTGRDPGRQGLFDLGILRMLLLGAIAFVFKLIAVICVGNNRRFILHFLHALLVAALAAFAVEALFALGWPVIGVNAIFWILMMGQIVVTA